MLLSVLTSVLNGNDSGALENLNTALSLSNELVELENKAMRLMLEAGADFICLSEPSGTGEVVGPKYFREFTVPYINKVMDALETPVKMVHMCGRLQRVYDQLPDIHSDVFSFDAVVSIRDVRQVLPDRALMGNVSTLAMQDTTPDRVRSMVHYVRGQGINVVAPACGLPTVTPLPVIQAMVEAAKEPMA